MPVVKSNFEIVVDSTVDAIEVVTVVLCVLAGFVYVFC